MQIELPDETIQQASHLAQEGEGVAEVIVRALESLRWERQEVAAVQEGIDAYRQGDFRPLEEFGEDLLDRYGVSAP